MTPKNMVSEDTMTKAWNGNGTYPPNGIVY